MCTSLIIVTLPVHGIDANGRRPSGEGQVQCIVDGHGFRVTDDRVVVGSTSDAVSAVEHRERAERFWGRLRGSWAAKMLLLNACT